MFTIDDGFLASIGYDVVNLSDEKKAHYIAELSTEFVARLQQRLFEELEEAQIEDWDRMQASVDNARAWLSEFHTDYRDRDDFHQVSSLMDNEDEAVLFYSSELWLRDAAPHYRDVIQEELDTYRAYLVDLRRKADELVG